MRSLSRPIVRPALTTGVLLAVGVLLTAAAVTDSRDVPVVLDGSGNRFDLQVAASVEPSWQPRTADWQQGKESALSVAFDDETAQGFAPGDTLAFRVAVKNASPAVDGALTLHITDPDPLGGQLTASGGHAELFDQLRFTVLDDGRTVIDSVPGSDLARLVHTWTGVHPGDARVLDVRVHMPAETDNRWASAATGVRFQWTGESE